MTQQSPSDRAPFQIPPVELTPKRFERAREALRAELARKGFRMTAVRESILRAALEYQGHFDAAALAEVLRDRSEISMTAVYRSIRLMVDARIIRPTLFSQGNSHLYEVTFEQPPHDHLVCQSCGIIVEFRFEAFAALRRLVAAMHAFELTSHVHEMSGVCAQCGAKKRS